MEKKIELYVNTAFEWHNVSFLEGLRNNKRYLKLGIKDKFTVHVMCDKKIKDADFFFRVKCLLNAIKVSPVVVSDGA